MKINEITYFDVYKRCYTCMLSMYHNQIDLLTPNFIKSPNNII